MVCKTFGVASAEAKIYGSDYSYSSEVRYALPDSTSMLVTKHRAFPLTVYFCQSHAGYLDNLTVSALLSPRWYQLLTLFTNANTQNLCFNNWRS